MKNFLVLISMFSFFIVFSQEKKFTIQYTLFFAEQDDSGNSEYKKIMAGVYKKSGQVNFNLYVKDSLSYFIAEDGIDNSNLSYQLALTKPLYSTPLFTNFNKKEIVSKNSPNFIFFDKNQFLIKRDFISNWEIQSETKVIDDKLCYKAVSKGNNYYHSKGKLINFDVTAWFCPEIPVNAGPVYFNNLPGLILEISYLDVKLVATSIKFDVDEKLIKQPTGKETVSYEEFNKLKEEMLEEKTKQMNEQMRTKE
ncbi:GLPGLI family protein [Flavobacterium sp.]|jgi:GLPGLI family protein|uniref:GLPGLI family protein n=1 Tax=Flavobacterium sp. TaxID=239 RepID=UPI0037BF74F5